MNKDTNLIWIDLEMTGLLPERDVIIEIATIVTDANLNILEEGPSMVIHQSSEILAGMDEWNTEHHTNSGLVQRVKDSIISSKQAEKQTIEFLEKHVNAGASPMCGNTVCQDRRFLYNYMPELEKFFHYRHIDVSTLKELLVRWKPQAKMIREGESAHLALADIRDSINELKYYRDVFIDV
ncbi:oligoribonuclease [Candidatus Thioglobus sp.]|jgi:oligoribonuclease|uniref:oligoribonuclease n=1 Tax=Candidatus Thioglobus sp. TaxID=2026721 RepID=UPI00233787FA|nr:oligoribonuclease [Candidatus Thioglobus sp.]MDB3869598.1 oligoribonuclease [Candidatus Thioglobus sp.]MDB3893412.1 oligoribonuclease [Candidatus Thioglobus sp.]MDC0388433.1 oligoribonuclease [Candidatus Thioglobus sp.]MDC0430789.1 oligoribonuclease [Candidatus Thioglobus sp.]